MPWRHEALTLAIIEIAWVEAFILARQMIGDEIHDDFHSFCMDAAHQLLKVGHRAQIRVDGMVIGNGIGRACTAFGDVEMRACTFRSVLQDTG